MSEENRKAIEAALVESGLTRTESQIYLTLLKKKNATAYRIAKDANLYRANTYKAIDNLLQKGIITKSISSGKQILKALPPEEIVSLLERQKEKIQHIIPLIERSFEEESEGIQIFKGISSFMNLLYKLLEQEESIYAFDIPSYVPDIVKIHIEKFHKSRIAKKVKMYHIYDYDANDRIEFLKKKKYTYARQGSTGRFSAVTTIVCGDATLIVNWKKGIKTILIKDKDISEEYIKQFKFLWDQE